MKNYSTCEIREKQLQQIAASFAELDGQEYTVFLAIKDVTPPNELNHILPAAEGLHFKSWFLH